MKTSFAIKREARQSLWPAYWPAFLICLVSFVLYGYVPNEGRGVPFTLYNLLERFLLHTSPLLYALQLFGILFLLYVFLINPLTVGRVRYFLRGIDGEWKFCYLVSPFLSRDYFRIVLMMGVRMLRIGIAPMSGLIIIFLAPLWVRISVGGPLVIIGIVVYYCHRLTPYLLAENPKLKFAVIKDMNAQISGERKFYGLFAIDFSFITWYIVGALFFGAGQFFFLPYHEATMAARYRELFGLTPNQAWLKQQIDPGDFNEPPPDRKPSDYSMRYSLIISLAIALTIILGMLPVTTASAFTEMEYVVTTEQELREAVEQNRSPIRVDTTIVITEGTIVIVEGQDIVLRGTGTLIMAHDDWRRATRHFSIFGGRLTLQEELSLISDVHIEYGGGVLVSHGAGYFIMDGGRIEYNRTRDGGGGVEVNNGTFRMHGGVIRRNHAGRDGGGVFLWSTTGRITRFFMTGGEISENTANSFGGGVSVVENSHFAMTGGQITGNHAERDGGGVALSFTSTFSMTDGEISYNHAGGFGGAMGMSGLGQRWGYENISIDPTARFHGNTADGQGRGGNAPRPHGSFGLHAGLEVYPQIHWDGDNSRPGTHLINNYDIAYIGGRRPAEWQIHLVLAGFILGVKGFAMLLFLRREKKVKSQEEGALCDTEE